MTRALAITLTAAALLGAASTAAASSNGHVPSIAAASAERGWPHQPSRAEIRDLTASVRRAVTGWAYRPDRGRCSFAACTFKWTRDDYSMRIKLAVYEDGSWETTSIRASRGLLPS